MSGDRTITLGRSSKINKGVRQIPFEEPLGIIVTGNSCYFTARFYVPRFDLYIERMNTAWTGTRLLRHVAYWLFWLLLYATVNAGKEGQGFVFWAEFELAVMTVKLPFTYLMMYVLVPGLLIRRRYVPFMLAAVVLAAIGGVLIWQIHDYLCHAYFERYHREGFFSSAYFYKTLDLVYISTFPVIYKLNQFYLREEARNRQIVEQKLHAELELLKNQLHPHFLFNTLNNLYGMVLSQHPRAADVVVRLSNLLSYMLYESNGNSIALTKEVEQLSNYIELEKIRYGERLSLSFECSGVTEQHHVAPLLLIGFIENAFKHGAASNPEFAWIRINLLAKGQQLDFLIENSCQASHNLKNEDFSKSGIGMANIQKRLELIYPGRHRLRIEHGDTYLVQLQLNLQNP
jgi:two-component system, LytTR family, sensor kinase